MKNTICTNEEYMKQGFTKEELPLIKMHDRLFNRFNTLTEDEKEVYFIIQKELAIWIITNDCQGFKPWQSRKEKVKNMKRTIYTIVNNKNKELFSDYSITTVESALKVFFRNSNEYSIRTRTEEKKRY